MRTGKRFWGEWPRRALLPEAGLLMGLFLFQGSACSPIRPEEAPTQNRHPLTVTLTDCLPASLINAITSANAATGASTITLKGGCVYTLTARHNYYYGPNGLPAIVNDLTIDGSAQGAIIERSTVVSTPSFRLFYVAGATLPPNRPGKLTLKNLTLRNGLAQGGASSSAAVTGGGGMGAGGAIFAQGEVTLSGVTLVGNQAIGGASAAPGTSTACGGGGGIGGNAITAFGGGFRNATTTAGGNGISNTEGGRPASATAGGAGGTNASGTEAGSNGAASAGGAG
ncbi:MAG TPA: hypothetical protein PKE31_17255, partial [Pseudomonadota bacterium]|nr:hypothetical protein [Pseudomonadota bacterium]